MIYLACVLGMIIGGMIGFSWRKSIYTNQLREIATLLEYSHPESNSLPVVSRLKRSLASIQFQHQELSEQIQSWQFTMQSAPIGFLLINADNQILWCNPQAQKYLHISDWPNNRLRLFLEVVRSYELDQLLSKTRASQSAQELEWQFYPSYDDRPLDSLARMLRASTIYFPDQMVGIFVDDLQPLVVLKQSRDRWTTDLAHELRTPLTSMRLVAETIQLKLEPPLANLADRLLMEIDRLAKLVQDFLDLSQIEETSSTSIRRVAVDISDLINKAWQGLEPLAIKNAVALCQQGDRNVIIHADPGRLMQVFINIFDNALKYSPHGGQIELNIYGHSDYVEIEVIDEGCGFNIEDLPYVFDRLFRGDTSRQYDSNASSITTGNGLGLAIVRQIVVAHSGTITASNDSRTGGGCLQIKLPIV